MGWYTSIKPDANTMSMPTLSTKWDREFSAEKLEFIEQYLSESAKQEDIEPVTHEVISTQLYYGHESRIKGELKAARSYFTIAVDLLSAEPQELSASEKDTHTSLESSEEKSLATQAAKTMEKYGLLKELLSLAVPKIDDIFKTQRELKKRSAELVKQLKMCDEQIKKNMLNVEEYGKQYKVMMAQTAEIGRQAAAVMALGGIGNKENINTRASINLIRDHINRYGDELSALEMSQQLLDLKLQICFELPCLHIPKMYGLSEATVAKGLGVPTSTFNRHKSNDVQKIVPEELAEKIILFIQLLERGITIFTSKKLMALWLTTPNDAFDMKKPVDHMQTIGQRIEAIRLLEQFNANSYR